MDTNAHQYQESLIAALIHNIYNLENEFLMLAIVRFYANARPSNADNRTIIIKFAKVTMLLAKLLLNQANDV